MRIAIVLALVACTHGPEPVKTAAGSAAPPHVIDARAPDAAPVAIDAAVASLDAGGPPVVRRCPKTYAAVAATACALDDAWKLACKYPDGHCECVIQQPCAGWAGAYEEAKEHPRAVWTCTPRVRDDGCPGDQPKIGARCPKRGQQCSYGSCGGSILACHGGAWAVEHVIGPPPAAPHP